MIHDLTTTADSSLATPVVIRPAMADDLPHLEWHGEFWALRGHFHQTFSDHLTGRKLMLVADLSGFPVGRLFVQLEAGNPAFADGHTRAYLYALQVMASLRGQGIGTRLIATAERELVRRGYGWATIAVAKNNSGAQRLYERLGYRVFHEDPGRWYYFDPDGHEHHVHEPCWVMEKPLPTGQ